jgi:hypothetical protein
MPDGVVDYLTGTSSEMAALADYVSRAWARAVLRFQAVMTPEFTAWIEAVVAEHHASVDGIDCWEGEGGSWH